MKKPAVSVITTVYNCEKYISQSVESILDQNFKDLEYIIVDDGSSDSTLSIIKDHAGRDPRLIIIENTENLGRVISLNKALERSSGKYIAIQDADDVSLPDRLKKQVEFMESDHEYVLTGCDITVVNERGEQVSQPVRPEKDIEAKFSLLFRCTFANPSIMYRRDVISRHKIKYEEEFIHSEDFRIISRISRHGRVKNLREKLLFYRRHESNNSKVNSSKLNENSNKIVRDNLSEFGFNISTEQAERLRRLISSKGIKKDFLLEDIRMLFDVIKKFRKQNPGSNREIAGVLRRMAGWLGKKNVMSKPGYLSLYVSILTYYSKEIIFKEGISENKNSKKSLKVL